MYRRSFDYYFLCHAAIEPVSQSVNQSVVLHNASHPAHKFSIAMFNHPIIMVIIS